MTPWHYIITLMIADDESQSMSTLSGRFSSHPVATTTDRYEFVYNEAVFQIEAARIADGGKPIDRNNIFVLYFNCTPDQGTP